MGWLHIDPKNLKEDIKINVFLTKTSHSQPLILNNDNMYLYLVILSPGRFTTYWSAHIDFSMQYKYFYNKHFSIYSQVPNKWGGWEISENFNKWGVKINGGVGIF